MRAVLILFLATSFRVLAGGHVSSADVLRFTADAIPPQADQHFATFTVNRAELGKILDTYHEVSAEVWTHHYSHVHGGDRTGTIILKDGQRLNWLVRPGGLATLKAEDGVTHYLVRELPKA